MYGRVLLPMLAFAILSAAVAFGLRTLIFREATIVSLLFSGAVGVGLYAGLILATDGELRALLQQGIAEAQGLWRRWRTA